MPKYSFGRNRSSSMGSTSSSFPGPGGPQTQPLLSNDDDIDDFAAYTTGGDNTTILTSDDRKASQRLLASIMYMKDRSGRSFVHTKYQLCWAKALLDRAKCLDDDKEGEEEEAQRQRHQQQQNHGRHKSSSSLAITRTSSSLLQRRFLLQQDEESGYTPLHRAVLESNLPAILLILRHVTNTDGGTERFTQRPMSVLHLADSYCNPKVGGNSGTSTTSNLVTMVTTAVDHEGMTPLQLLGMLQRSELQACRNALDSNRP
eukprot:CAMPEP_0113507340 /NCGR_PEP_ID=MMETSP0014_2-20120614/36409_1 /TAXON_ID=2857 /ORGANISM="Nitzschia sp." /LENGTH=258 /DNA_ID=CAMNT_0000402935 /DNA_START=165 /DNA_END=937 /DNA_ORIENTATION=+ /assembly_acc=CAM_ASM_000159